LHHQPEKENIQRIKKKEETVGLGPEERKRDFEKKGKKRERMAS